MYLIKTSEVLYISFLCLVNRVKSLLIHVYIKLLLSGQYPSLHHAEFIRYRRLLILKTIHLEKFKNSFDKEKSWTKLNIFKWNRKPHFTAHVSNFSNLAYNNIRLCCYICALVHGMCFCTALFRRDLMQNDSAKFGFFFKFTDWQFYIHILLYPYFKILHI